MVFISLLFASASLLVSCDAILAAAVQGARTTPAASDGGSEGTEAAPVELVLDTTFAARVAAKTSSYDKNYSYYKFTPAASGVYDMLVSSDTSTDGIYADYCLDRAAYSSAYNPANLSTTPTAALSRLMVEIGKSLYIRVSTTSYAAVKYSIKIMNHAGLGDGTPFAPVELVIDTSLSAKAAKGNTGESSYYVVKPSLSGNYNLNLSDVSASTSLSFTCGTESTFSSDAGSGSTLLSSKDETVIKKMALVANTSYYIKVTSSSTSPATTFKLLMTLHHPPNEGSAASPVVLTVGASYDAKVGGSIGDEDESFYSVTPSESGIFDLTATGTSSLGLYAKFGKNSAFPYNSYVTGSASGTDARRLLNGVAMASGTTYYIQLSSSLTTDQVFSLKFVTHVPENNGSQSSPEALTADVAFSASTGSDTSIDKTSYYSFTPTVSGMYQIKADTGSSTSRLYFYAYWGTAADYSSYDLYKYCTWTDSSVVQGPSALVAGTSYYLRLVSGSSNAQSFKLTAQSYTPSNEGSASAPIVLTPGAGNRACKIGNSSDTERSSYYVFTTHGTGFTVSATSVANAADLNFYIYPSTSPFVSWTIADTSTGNSGSGLSAAGASLAPAGTYYLEIKNYSGSATTFSLKVTSP